MPTILLSATILLGIKRHILKYIPALTMLGLVKSDGFIFLINPETYHPVNDLKDYQSSRKDKYIGRHYSNSLNAEKRWVSKNKPSLPAGFIAVDAKSPVARAPHVPPTPCMPKTSRESSYPSLCFSVTAM